MILRILFMLLLASPSWAGDYYVHGNFPSPSSPASSAAMRAELDLIASGFAKLPSLAGNGGKVVVVNGGATGLTTTTGTLSLSGNFSVTGAFAVTFVTQAPVTLTLPAVSGTLSTLNGLETLSNKTIISSTFTGPLGITKADVGLDNVDNTSDATKNAATATLTNKTLVDPVLSGTVTGTYTSSVTATGSTTSRTLANRFAGRRTLKDSAAVGDGSANDATAIQSAIALGDSIDGEGLTYKVNSPLTGVVSGQVFSNMTLDFSSMPAQTGQDKCITISGTKGSAVALTANSPIDDLTVQVGSTATFSVDQWVWLESAAVWSSATSAIFGQYGKVKTVDSATQLTLYDGVVMAFNTADTATISPVTPVQRVKFKNVKILGAQANNQTGLWFEYCLDCSDEDLVIENVDYTGVILYRTINYRGSATVRNAEAAGLAYGYVPSSGAYGTRIIGGFGDDLRHYVAIGGTGGVNLYTVAANNIIVNSQSAALDAHPSSMFVSYVNNQISLKGGDTTEGITVQGLHNIVTGNIIKGVGDGGWGIGVQPLVTASGVSTTATIADNWVYFNDTSTGTSVGVSATVDATTGTNWASASIRGNHFRGGANATSVYHVYVQANRDSSTMNNIAITGNVSVDAAKTHAVFVRTNAANSVISNVLVSGNILKASGTRALYLLADGASSLINKAILTGNMIDGGSAANISLLATGGGAAITDVTEDNNSFVNGNVLYTLSGTTTGLKLKSARHETPVTITNGTYTLTPLQDTLIANRAGTVTITLPTAASFPGRELLIKTIQAQAVDSASGNVQPIDSVTLGAAILPANDGAWCILKSNGTDWVVMQRGT